MPNNPELPLHVYQVLEEEYVSLYGPIPPDEVLFVALPDERAARSGVDSHTRVVEAKLDWAFRRGHLKNPVGLAADLLLGAGVQPDEDALREVSGTRDDPARAKLREYLYKLIGRPTLEALALRPSPAEPGRDLVIPLEDALNKCLTDRPDLYAPERFSDDWLGAAARGLVRLRPPGAGFDSAGTPASGAEEGAGVGGEGGAEGPAFRSPLAHFNRLLLEDAFPDYIEKSHDIRLAAIHQRLHGERPAALSLSGGGIRSGTFALGLIQGLARHNLLEKFDYLSTVSGGGYTGGWLTAWLHRHADGMSGVTHDLANSNPVSKIDPDAPPLQHLRRYSNFITPKVGFLTADTWAFAGIYLRNLLLNWLVFIPLLLGLLMLPRVALTFTTFQPVNAPQPVTSIKGERPLAGAELEKLKDVPAEKQVVYRTSKRTPVLSWFLGEKSWEEPDRGFYWRHLLLIAGFLFGVWALGYVGFNRPSERGALLDHSKFWHARTDQSSFLKYCLAPLVASAALLTVYWAWAQEGATVSKSPLRLLLFGFLFTIFGWLIASFVLGRFRPLTRLLKEGVAIILAGLLGGLLFWIVSLFEFGDPIIGYGVGVRDGTVLRLPFAWTDWTKWTWSSWTTELYVCLGVPVFLLIVWAATTFFVGVSSSLKGIGDEDREWWARFGAWLLIAALAWAVINAVVIFGPVALLASPKLLGTIGGLSGLIAVLVGRSARTPAREGAADDKGKSKAGAVTGLLGSSLTVLGLVFLAAFLSLLSLAATGITWKFVQEVNEWTLTDNRVRAQWAEKGVEWLTNIPRDSANGGFDDYVSYTTPVVPTLVRPAPTPQPGAPDCQPVCTKGPAASDDDWKLEEADAYTGATITHLNVLHHTHILFNLGLLLLFLLVGLVLSRVINLNVFSLHGGYRDRLIRGFLGASRPPGERRTNPFTGFDPADNIRMHELRWALLDEADLRDAHALAAELRPEALPAAEQERRKRDNAKAGNQLTDYLRKERLLGELFGLTNIQPSPDLKRALRMDLNRVLETQKLYVTFENEYLKSPRATRIRQRILKELEQKTGRSWAGAPLGEIPLRSEYSILLNRLVLEMAYPGMFRPGLPPPYKMLHVVNTTLNLVGGNNLAWQQRKAEPFSVSPLHAGCFRVGYRRSRDYGGDDGISLGTAVATSGAAASSNMGYLTTSPVVSLLLTLFNVRLGWWLGNPGPAGNKTYWFSTTGGKPRMAYQRRAPSYSVGPVVAEAFGLTDDTHPFVYLTDGGHFENLALYEMVLRRCHIIVCSDAAEDHEYRFGDLGSAVRKIRIDLGVSIDFPCVEIYNPDTLPGGKQAMYWALGRIRYSCVDRLPQTQKGAEKRPAEEVLDGVLLYVKPAVYGNEPRDVLEYKKSFPAFPQQSTADQFFDEPQFESYRALGSFIMDEMCGPGFEELDLKQVVGRAFARLHAVCAANGKDLDAKFAEWLSGLSGFRIVAGKVEPPPESKPDAGVAPDAPHPG